MRSNLYYWLLAGVLSVLLVLVFGGGDRVTAQAENSTTDQEYTVLLPVVRANYPLPISMFGVEIIRGHVGRSLEKATQAYVPWTRYHGIQWHQVEAERGVIDWDKLSLFETEIIALSQAGIEPMVIIFGTPAWARFPNHPDHVCGPIRQDALADFADFLTVIVERYSRPPYSVSYWELGNEPDVDPDYIPATYPFGCWGDDQDWYFGGEYYAEMLKVAYPAIKRADPHAQVILGGLLMDCDPANSPPQYTCTSGNFLEGVLRNGGGDYLDIIAYHSYPFWYGTSNEDWDLIYSKWNARGGILLGKLDLIREVMAKYGVQKPVLMNEGGLMCGYPSTDTRYTLCQTDTFNGHQANYVVRLYIRSWANGLTGAAWYTLNGPGWREGGLLDKSASPRLSYKTFEFLSDKLHTAQFAQQLSGGTLEGYEFGDLAIRGKRYQVYWSNQATTFQINLPPGTVAVYNRYGTPLAFSGSTFMVGFDPVLIEILP